MAELLLPTTKIISNPHCGFKNVLFAVVIELSNYLTQLLNINGIGSAVGCSLGLQLGQ